MSADPTSAKTSMPAVEQWVVDEIRANGRASISDLRRACYGTDRQVAESTLRHAVERLVERGELEMSELGRKGPGGYPTEYGIA